MIAAVNGAAAGAGMGLACACDLVIAAESARFTTAYTKIGLGPDGTTTYFLPRRIGIGRALQLVLLNRALSAKEAVDWGIANRIVADASLAEEAHSTAAQLAAGPIGAYGAAKLLMQSGFTEASKLRLKWNRAASERWRAPRMLARQSRPSRPSGHRCSLGAEMGTDTSQLRIFRTCQIQQSGGQPLPRA